MEFVVYLSSTDRDDDHRGRQSVRLRRHQGRHQQSLFVCAVVGARQGRDADTQGLTRRALKTSRDAFKGHRVLARAAAEVHTLLNVSEALQREPRGSVQQQ